MPRCSSARSSDAGWTVRAVPVQGAEALSAALQRRGWQAVLFGGDGPAPCRRERRSRSSGSPTRTCRSSPSRRTCGPATCPRSCAGSRRRPERLRPRPAPDGPDPRARAGAHAPPRRRRPPPARPPSRRSPITSRRASSRRRCASAYWPRSARRWAGPPAPSGAPTAPCCAASSRGMRPARAPPWPRLTNATREQTYAAGQGLPGRVWAFRRAGLGRRLPGRGPCAPAWSPPPRSRSRTATSASA